MTIDPSQSERPMPSWRDPLQKHLTDDPRHDQTSPEQGIFVAECTRARRLGHASARRSTSVTTSPSGLVVRIS